MALSSNIIEADSTTAFSLYSPRRRTSGRWIGAVAAALIAYGVVSALVLLVASEWEGFGEHKVDVSLVDKVTFLQKVAKSEAVAPEPAPAPAPQPPAPEVKIPAAAAPIVPPNLKVRRLTEKPPVKEFRAPRQMPTAVPEEADPSKDKGVAVYGQGGKGDAAGLEGGIVDGGVAGGIVGGAVELPDDAVPPRLLSNNAIPPYPMEARASRKTGTVVLKVVVFANGTVGEVQVLEGEEPFVSSAVQAVKSWRYEPARFKGRPIAVYRVIRIPFKLTG